MLRPSTGIPRVHTQGRIAASGPTHRLRAHGSAGSRTGWPGAGRDLGGTPALSGCCELPGNCRTGAGGAGGGAECARGGNSPARGSRDQGVGQRHHMIPGPRAMSLVRRRFTTTESFPAPPVGIEPVFRVRRARAALLASGPQSLPPVRRPTP